MIRSLLNEMKLGLAISAVGMAIGVGGLVAADAAEAKGKRVCQEDQRCWNWATMGNQQRGVVLNTPAGEPTRRAILGPCAFAYYNYNGWIDWERTRPLKGDRLAMRRGCDPYLFG
jgi:hypothetical protein